MIFHAMTERYEEITVCGKPALFTSARIQTNSVPDGWYCYDLRGSDDEPGEPVTIEPYVVINHAGSVLTHEKINIPGEGFLRRPLFDCGNVPENLSRLFIRQVSVKSRLELNHIGGIGAGIVVPKS